MTRPAEDEPSMPREATSGGDGIDQLFGDTGTIVVTADSAAAPRRVRRPRSTPVPPASAGPRGPAAEPARPAPVDLPGPPVELPAPGPVAPAVAALQEQPQTGASQPTPLVPAGPATVPVVPVSRLSSVWRHDRDLLKQVVVVSLVLVLAAACVITGLRVLG